MKWNAIKMLIPLLTGSATSAFASAQGAEQGNGMLVWFLIGFGVMVVLFQATPAAIMFFSMIKGLFSTDPSEASFSPWKGKSPK